MNWRRLCGAFRSEETVFIKALEIQGFKSFPDKTVLQFGEDVTAIVGPNGSGKSNISDAIRWVMGEQSAKGLRGAKMEDVIFGGTEKRSPLGFAQVTLVLDNTARLFPNMEENEVAVTRRYYRSGESEYYINRQSVRLKDVTELFMDTGMGREGYSIIGQGRIDEILSAKSGERREVFEEAAGISRFRHRKEEAERKLSRTDENLTRVSDKIEELQLQVEPLREQSEKAKRYLILRDELRLLEISVWLTDLETLHEKAVALQSELASARIASADAKTELDRLFAESERLTGLLQQKDIEADAIRARESAIADSIRDAEAEKKILESRIEHEEENIRRVEEEIRASGERAGSLEQEAAAADQEAADALAAASALTAKLEKLLSEAQEMAQRSGGVEAEAEALRREEEALLLSSAARRAEGERLHESAETAKLRALTAAQNQEDVKGRLEMLQQERRESRESLKEAEEERTAESNVIAGFRLRLRDKQAKADAATAKRMDLTVRSGAIDERIRLLENMERDYEGFSRAVKTVMQAGKNLRGIHAPVAELIRTEGDYALAIEIALGAGMQNIVVDDEEAGRDAIRYLKRRDAGRATFLPLTTIRGDVLRETSLAREAGFVGIASELVQFEARYAAIFRSLLGRTVICEDLDAGIQMARRHQNAFRIVTLDGQVINRGGSMTGGSAGHNTGVLSRKAELEQLREEALSLHGELDRAKQAESEAQRSAEADRYQMETAEDRLRLAEDRCLRLEEAEKRYAMQEQALGDSLAKLAQEKAGAEASAKSGKAEADAALSEAAEKEQKAETLKKRREALLNDRSDLLARQQALNDETSLSREQIAEQKTSADAAHKRSEDLRALAASLGGDLESREAALREHQANIQGFEQKITEHEETLGSLRLQKGAEEKKLLALQDERLTIEAQRTAANNGWREQNDLLLTRERGVATLEQRAEATALEEKQILDRLWERYELSRTDAMAQRQELESLPEANKRIAELRRQINRLGTPNLGAIEEFERVNTRYTYLTNQRDDIQTARADLEEIIAEITGEMTRIFAQQFKLLQESFQKTFLDLFGGGKAALELEDPGDILNCGIEIKAQPPGKALKTISLLSGGEKAFVAIALYFAIIKVHPTPFCVMDEIEAALDDVNVTRTARYMRTLSGQTQFIVITHRRGTMEEADVLYGITMQEQGVSKVLSIDLNSLSQDLKIEQ